MSGVRIFPVRPLARPVEPRSAQGYWMPFAVIARYLPNSEGLRDRHLQDHIDYLDAERDKLIAAGALLAADGATAVGALYLLNLETRQEVDAFIANDPFAVAGLFADVAVDIWRKTYFDHRRLLDPLAVRSSRPHDR